MPHTRHSVLLGSAAIVAIALWPAGAQASALPQPPVASPAADTAAHTVHAWEPGDPGYEDGTRDGEHDAHKDAKRSCEKPDRYTYSYEDDNEDYKLLYRLGYAESYDTAFRLFCGV
ncbi:hypothetical protein AB0J63_29695 [Streptosporangium canum]|uniref:hypothetical protein n=1 Tax=Streptosporangium canum TaxID=324952 RepID=UPI00343668A4